MTRKQKAWCFAFLETLDATEAAMRAYNCHDRNTASSIGAENLRKPDLAQFLKEEFRKLEGGRIISIQEVMARVTDILRDPNERTRNKLKAADMMLKAGGAYLHPDKSKGAFWGETGSEDVIIYLPELQKKEECLWHDPEENDNPEKTGESEEL